MPRCVEFDSCLRGFAQSGSSHGHTTESDCLGVRNRVVAGSVWSVRDWNGVEAGWSRVVGGSSRLVSNSSRCIGGWVRVVGGWNRKISGFGELISG